MLGKQVIAFSTSTSNPAPVAKLLTDSFNLGLSIQGDRILLDRHTVTANADAVPILRKIHVPISLAEVSPKEIFRRTFALRSGNVDEIMPEPPTDLISIKGFGLLSELEATLRQVALTQPNEIEEHVTQSLIPTLQTKFKATHVVPVTINSTRQQTFISIARVFHLVKEHGLEKARKLAADSKFLQSILPSGLDIHHYANSFLMFSPLFAAIPVLWRDVIWFFLREKGWIFPLSVTDGIGPSMTYGLPSVLETSRTPLPFHQSAITVARTNTYFEFVVAGINRLMAFQNDWGNFTNNDDTVDLAKQIQCYSAIKLLIADLRGISAFSDVHVRTNQSFEALDKISNIVEGLTGARDENVWAFFASGRIQRVLKSIFDETPDKRYDDVKPLLRSSLRVFDGIRKTVVQSVGRGMSEQEVGLWLRHFRNLRHGSFLRGGRFDEVFIHSPGILPDTFPFLPHVILFGLMSNPKLFLNAVSKELILEK